VTPSVSEVRVGVILRQPLTSLKRFIHKQTFRLTGAAEGSSLR